MEPSRSSILRQPVPYASEAVSIRDLEEDLTASRRSLDERVRELTDFRQQNDELQQALVQELQRLQQATQALSKRQQSGGSLWGSLRELLGSIPGLRGTSMNRRSIEDLLRSQYELSSVRLKEAGELADRLELARHQLYEEIDRLNERIVTSAKDEELAADFVLQVDELRQELEAELTAAEPASAAARQLQAELDQARRVLAVHSTKLQLYSTAEDRLSRLKDNTSRLAQTIANLHTDIIQYVQLAAEKLDLASGQIQAIGTAADASVVMLELKRSLDVMTESMNTATRFVSNTQVVFRENMDRLVDELELYDAQTQAVLERNLAISEVTEEQRISEAVTSAMYRRTERELQGSPAADPLALQSAQQEQSHELDPATVGVGAHGSSGGR